MLASWNMRAVCLYKKITASQIHMSLHVLSSSEVIINSCIQWWLSMGDTNVVYMYMYICCSNSSVYFFAFALSESKSLMESGVPGRTRSCGSFARIESVSAMMRSILFPHAISAW